MSKPNHFVLGGFVVALCITCLIGVWLRWSLTGAWSLGPFTFAHLKHAHSHLGYFGVIFPLLFIAWKQRGSFALSTKWQWGYALAILLCTIGFARAGYKLDAIIGSTIVGLAWLIAAWKQRSLALHRAQWMPIVPWGILLASACIPPIALFTRKDPLFAQQLVRTFLSALLFLVAFPTLLERLRVPAPIAGVWLLCGVAGALFLGVVPHPLPGIGLVAMALLLQWKLSHLPPTPKARAWQHLLVLYSWFGWSLGAIGMGVHALPNQHHIAISGLHFTILGPLLLSAWWLFAPHTMLALLVVPYAIFVLLMSAAIAAQALLPHPLWPQLTAITGSAIALFVFAIGLALCLLPKPGLHDLPAQSKPGDKTSGSSTSSGAD